VTAFARTGWTESHQRGETDGRTAVTANRRCYRDGQFEQAVGIALESRRLDQLEAATKRSPAPVKTLTYALRVSQRLVISRQFREQVSAPECRNTVLWTLLDAHALRFYCLKLSGCESTFSA